MRPATVLGSLTLIAGLAGSALGGKAPQGFTPGHLFIGTEEGTLVELDDELDVVQVFEVADEDVEVRGLAFGPDGLLYAALSTRVVVTIDFEGDVDEVLDLSGEAGGALAFGPDGVLLASEQNALAALDALGDVAPDLNLDGVDEGTIAGLDLGPGGELFLAANESNAGTRDQFVFEFDAGGRFVRRIEVSSAFGAQAGQLAVAGTGVLFAAVPFEGHVVRIEVEDGEYEVETLGDDELVEPRGLAIGPDGLVYVLDEELGELFAYESTGDLRDRVGDEDFEDGICLAFAPWRLKAAIRGQFASDDELSRQRVKSGWVSIAPGTGTILLRFDEDEFLADGLGTPAFAFHGHELGEGDPKRRLYQGSAVAAPALERGIGHVLLSVTGKLEPSGRFTPRRARGSFERTTADAAFLGALRGKKGGGGGD